MRRLMWKTQLEVWRQEPYVVKTQTSDLFKNLTGPDPYPTVISPDHVVSGDNRIVWRHHNERRENDDYEINMKLQGLAGLVGQMPHPLVGRTFGGAIEGDGLVQAGDHLLRSAQQRRRQHVRIHALTRHPSTVEQWRTELDESIRQANSVDYSTARASHLEWWRQFWDRSWIFIHSDDPAAFEVTRGYVLQRFMNACAGGARSRSSIMVRSLPSAVQKIPISAAGAGQDTGSRTSG